MTSAPKSTDHAPARADRRQPLYEQIKKTLRQQILDGRYAPLDRMPSEHELIDRYGVSRITVRQALGDLERDGLIFRLHGKGSFVSKPKATQDLSRLQGFGEAMAGLGRVAFNRVRSLKLVKATPAVAAALELAPGSPVTQIKRVRALDHEPVSVELSHVPGEWHALMERADLASRDLYDVLENDAAVDIGHAEVSLEARLADAAVAKDLRIAAGDAVLHLERLTRDSAGRAIDHDLITFRGDAFRYRLKVERAHTGKAK